MLASLERHLKHGGSTLRDVYIQAVFSFDQPEILSMLESIKNLQGVNTLTLDALYDELDDHNGKSSALGPSCMLGFLRTIFQMVICRSVFSFPEGLREYLASGIFALI
jgi:hypothetical protein